MATLLGGVALLTGLIDDADARLREAVRLSREIGAVSAEAFASLRLGEAARARGEIATGNTLLADALVISRWSPISGHLLPLGYATLLRSSDDPKLGLEHLEDGEAYLASSRSSAPTATWPSGWPPPARRHAAGSSIKRRIYLAAAEATTGLWRAEGPGRLRSTRLAARSPAPPGIVRRPTHGYTRPARRSPAKGACSTPAAFRHGSSASPEPWEGFGKVARVRSHQPTTPRRTLDEHLRNPSPQRLAHP